MQLQSWQVAITAALPAISTTIAGILRQDKLPPWINELISLLVLVASACLNVLFNGKITGNVYADFLLVSSYIGVLMHQPLGIQVQQYLQSNVLSLGKVAGGQLSEMEQLAALLLPQLGPQIAQELQRLGLVAAPGQGQAAPASSSQFVQVPSVQSANVAPSISAQFTAPVLPGVKLP